MADGEKLRRFGLDKLAFLALLLLGLLLARIFISARSSFELSQSIGLKGTGLEVSLPASDNWKRLSNDFKFEDNEFRFTAVMQISSDSAITALWRYSLIPVKIESLERFNEIAASLEGHIESSGTDAFGQFTFDYAKIDSEKAIIFVGTTVLPNGRILTLEIGQRGAGVELAEKVFKALLASVKFNPDNSFAKGVKFLKEFKTSFLPDLPESELASQNVSDFFRIKDAGGNSIGFTTDTLSYVAEANDNLPLVSASLLFLSPSYNTLTEQMIFRSDITLSKFDWMIKQSHLLTNRHQSIHIQLGENGFLTIEKSGKISQIPFTDVMIPDTLLDLAVASFLKSDYDTIYIEALLSDGRISPVILSRIKSTQTAALPERSAAQADFFGAITANQKMYFDGRGRLVSADVQGGLSYRLERTTRAAILIDFPQWIDKIQQIEQYQKKKESRSKKD